MTDLGAVLERYETSNRRRAVTGALAVTAGAPVVVLGAFVLLTVDVGRAGSIMFFAGIFLGGGLGAAVMGTILAVQSVTRRGEHFTLHEHGFVHTWGAKTITVPWTDVATVTDVGKKTFLSKAFGGDVACQIRLVNGRKVTVNAFTEGAELLIHRVFEATGTARAE
ncbi:hypothetical protein [Lentzea sp. NPDC092896]|uniref:hypothetical protein n=1 Tax=Lentzea sp. NPDC092896 TaxID=3364127 RepID=UPI0038211F98